MKNRAHSNAEFYKMLGINKGDFRSRKLIRYCKKTKEHLVKKQWGGTNAAENIVYAHLYCNSHRGDKEVLEHLRDTVIAVLDGTHPLSAIKNPA